MRKKKKKSKKSLVYISAPYGGKQENFDKVTVLMKGLMEYSDQFTFISPIHAQSFEDYHETDYEVGLKHCIDILDRCDEMWVFGGYNSSRGCEAEIEFCNKNIKPVRYFLNYKVDVNELKYIDF